MAVSLAAGRSRRGQHVHAHVLFLRHRTGSAGSPSIAGRRTHRMRTAHHTSAGTCTRGCPSSRTPAARTGTLRCRRAPAARSSSWTGRTRGPAQRARAVCTRQHGGRPGRQSAGCGAPQGGAALAQTARRALDQRSPCARLVVGPAVLAARRARHVRYRATRIHYDSKLPLRRAQHERGVEVPAQQPTNPRTPGLKARWPHCHRLARPASVPAAACTRERGNCKHMQSNTLQ